MKKLLVFGVCVLINIINSCTGRGSASESIGKNDVKIIGYGYRDEIKWEAETQVIINDSTDFIEYIYPDDLTQRGFGSFYAAKRILQNDSLLIFMEDTTRLVNSKTYEIDGKKWKVKKYFGGAGGPADGEYLVYWNDELGLVCVQSQIWGDFDMFFYENDQISQVLKADTLGLFDRFGD